MQDRVTALEIIGWLASTVAVLVSALAYFPMKLFSYPVIFIRKICR